MLEIAQQLNDKGEQSVKTIQAEIDAAVRLVKVSFKIVFMYIQWKLNIKTKS